MCVKLLFMVSFDHFQNKNTPWVPLMIPWTTRNYKTNTCYVCVSITLKRRGNQRICLPNSLNCCWAGQIAGHSNIQALLHFWWEFEGVCLVLRYLSGNLNCFDTEHYIISRMIWQWHWARISLYIKYIVAMS